MAKINIFQFLLLMIFSLFITSCGGGGSSSQPKNEFALSLTKSNATTSCPIYSYCSVDIRANYVGEPPKNPFIIITKDTNLIDITVSVYETYADINFSASNLPAGKYKGLAVIDICKDSACSKKYTPSYTIAYDFFVTRSAPEFSTKPISQSVEPIITNIIQIDNFLGTNEKYELNIEMPDTATEVIMPSDFITEYQLEKISSTRFYIIPPIKFSPQSFAFTFIGQNYNRTFDVTIQTNHILRIKNLPPIAYQAIGVGIDNFNRQPKYQYFDSISFNDPYYGNPDLKQSVSYVHGSNWVETTSNLWNLTLNIIPPTEYGIYEAYINLTLNDETFTYPLVLAHSKTYKQAVDESRLEIKPSTNSLEPGYFYHIWDNCYVDACQYNVFSAKPISNWVKNVEFTHTVGTLNYYRYEIDIEKLSEIFPYTGIPHGIVTLSSTDSSQNYLLAYITPTLNIPSIYYTKVKKSPSNTPFLQTIFGFNLDNFEGVEIIKLEKDSNNKLRQSINRFFYSTAALDLKYNESLSFEMPSLTPGVYQLNFSGIFSKYYPEFLLEVE